MTCVHLRGLYKLCQEHDLKLGSSDLIRVVAESSGRCMIVVPLSLTCCNVAACSEFRSVDDC